MTTASLQTIAPASNCELLRSRLVTARLDALAEMGLPRAEACAIARDVTIDIVEVVGLLRHGCPPELVLPILA